MTTPDRVESKVDAPWSLPTSEVLRLLDGDAGKGLSPEEAARRLVEYGPNSLREAKQRSAWSILTGQFMSLVVLLLAIAAVAAGFLGEWLDTWAIVAVLVINAVIGFITEFRAVRSMAALRALGGAHARVRRAATRRDIAAQDLVPGDLLILEAGDRVAADARLLECARLEIDESALTGESMPAAKSVEVEPESRPLADRQSMLWKGTAVVRGSALAVVTATGMATELGRIAELVESAEDSTTPLEARLATLGRRLLVVTLVIAALIFVIGILAGRSPMSMVITAIALAVAAIPEGLPIVATMALARGMWRMARRKALINRLSAVETLGSTTVIFTDKTGTLTENRMTLRSIVAPSGEFAWPEDASRAASQQPLLRALVLCNDAEIDGEAATGDPMELAFIEGAQLGGVDHTAIEEKMPRLKVEPFDSDVMMMASFNRDGDRVLVTVKGAPERILEVCSRIVAAEGGPRPLNDEDRKTWHEKDQEMARAGARVLAAAEKTLSSADAAPFEDLTFLGLVALADPPRSDVVAAIEACHRAGIAVHMVTGDQPATAGAIAREVGIGGSESPVSGTELAEAEGEALDELRSRSVFARVTPAQKLELVRYWQDRGAVVAMTGDGVNDAPALKKADIGIAMGQRGTQVARDAADMVLTDDSFPAIVAAVEEGRVIFGNIRKVVLFLLSCNVSEVMVVAIGTSMSGLAPLTPLQILFLNLITDVFPALALAFGEGPRDTLDRKPRARDEDIVSPRHWRGILIAASIMSIGPLGGLLLGRQLLGLDDAGAVTVAFLGLGLGQLWHVLDLRSSGSSLFANEIFRNRWLQGSIVACTLLFGLTVTWTPLMRILGTAPLGLAGLGLALLASLPTVVVGQFLLRRGRGGYFPE